ncbi:flagellar brake protein [Propionivibrio sp.]|uniref:flagellar brake protein n=1 Tax=Propionivibrio sp. TaxID=2212460 RepID=UPI0025CCC8FF|nr:flagellar brake protein [Propionivibrio sp.]MBK7357370.1 flagellar brake protein [Propionivibrio sp.]MBK8401226.1 flagellar brake protein [Propionivibrio sp.]MBK8743218.1 flagellar brake protein [Propionivibrio sp.]MBK8894777.1 flagellar brake protein [Propionivibrio sp.]MBL0209011.1 flagellar brake protein [Propionivibrio sp.]
MSNPYTDEDIERCTLSGSREILFQLRSLIKHSERVSVTFDEGRQSFLTVLIDISADDGQLIFDIGGSEETNRAFLKAERCQFAGILEGIRIQFYVKQARMVKINGEHVFTVDLPSSILRLQRRDAFRLHLPTTKPYICRVRRGSANEKALPLRDISVGGIGTQVAEQLAYDPLERLENSWIDLRESGIFTVTLEVRYIQSTESRSGKPLWHMGCRFLNLTAHDETLIQRFMARVEAERRALSAE